MLTSVLSVTGRLPARLSGKKVGRKVETLVDIIECFLIKAEEEEEVLGVRIGEDSSTSTRWINARSWPSNNSYFSQSNINKSRAKYCSAPALRSTK